VYLCDLLILNSIFSFVVQRMLEQVQLFGAP